MESAFITKQISNSPLIAKLLKFEYLFIDLEVYLDNLTYKGSYKIEYPKSILILILHIIGNLSAESENLEVIDVIN